MRADIARLQQDNSVPELDALVALGNERDLEVVAKALRDAIDRDELETASTIYTPSSSST